MKAILISIKPQYVEKIINGTKKYEFRKTLPKNICDTMLIYCTSPIKKVVASAKIEEVLSDSLESLWKKTEKYSGINYERFIKYFNNTKIGYAYKLNSVQVFKTPKDIIDYGISIPPQSFFYVNL